MVEMIDARRHADVKEERYDLFSGLLDAAQGDLDGGQAITEQELFGKVTMPYRSRKRVSLAIPGNTFAFLLAGHEVGTPISVSGVIGPGILDNSPHSWFRVRFTCSLPQRARALVSANQGHNGRY